MPNRKIQLPVRITAPQLAALKAEAERLGISVGELVRRVVDGWREMEGK